MQKKIIKIFLTHSYSLFFAIAFLIVCLIFRNRLMIATGDEGLPIYNPSRTFNYLSSFWLERDLGLDNPFNIPRLPFYAFTVLLQSIGLQSWVIQAVTFFILITTAFVSVYKLCLYFFANKFAAFTSALFYFFNLYTMSQVFFRFIYSLMFLWAYLPLFLYIWIKWLDTSKNKYLFYLILTSLFFSDAFGLTSSVLALWIPAGLMSLIKLFRSKLKARVIFTSILGLIAWALCNLWWIYPVLALKSSSYATFLDDNKVYTSLKEVSIYFPNSSIFQLKQDYWFSENGAWSDFYNPSSERAIASTTIFLLTLIGLSWSRKFANWYYVISIGLVSWIIVKGTNPPFGEHFYNLLYKYIPIFQVLRNPYEKFGSVWILIYSIFFSLGLTYLSSVFFKAKRIRNLTIFVLLLITFVYLPLPFWNGNVFRTIDYVEIPKYYDEANAYLLTKGDGRILQLPFLKDSVVTYKWGYTGEEPSEYLFSKASISKTTHIPQLDDFYLFMHKAMYSDNFSNLLAITNTDAIIVNNAIVKDANYREDVEATKTLISNWKNVEFDSRIGELDIYNHKNANGLIYLLPKLEALVTTNDILLKLIDVRFNPKKDGYYSNIEYGGEFSFNSLKIPLYEYKKHSPQKYSVTVQSAVEPYLLVLSNNYNSNWILRLNGEQNSKHIKVNGFANGWLIDKKGDYTIDIQFKIWPWQ